MHAGSSVLDIGRADTDAILDYRTVVDARLSIVSSVAIVA